VAPFLYYQPPQFRFLRWPESPAASRRLSGLKPRDVAARSAPTNDPTARREGFHLPPVQLGSDLRQRQALALQIGNDGLDVVVIATAPIRAKS